MKKIISLILTIAMILTFTLVFSSCGKEYYFVEMSVRDCGKMIILLDRGTAPITVDNFLSLVESGFYDGLTFHRIMEGFMIQGGEGGSSKTIKGEFSENGVKNNIAHVEGVISMARTNDPDSATSQFFICNADARASLDGKYAAFGWVVEGLDVVHKITALGMPKTNYYEYYATNPQIWQYYGNGIISNKADQPVIEYIKVIDYEYNR